MAHCLLKWIYLLCIACLHKLAMDQRRAAMAALTTGAGLSAVLTRTQLTRAQRYHKLQSYRLLKSSLAEAVRLIPTGILMTDLEQFRLDLHVGSPSRPACPSRAASGRSCSFGDIWEPVILFLDSYDDIIYEPLPDTVTPQTTRSCAFASRPSHSLV